MFPVVRHPFVAVPKPDALVAQAFREQPQADRFVEQFKNKLRRRRMRDAQAFPVHAVIRLRLAQMQQQPVAQFADRHGRLSGQIPQHRRRRRVAQQEKRVADERERRLVVEKFRVGDGMIFAAGQRDAVREGKFLVAVFQMRRERDDLSVKMQRLAVVGEIRGGSCGPSARAIGAVPRRTSTSVSAPSLRWRCVSAIHWMNSQSAGGNSSCSCVARTTRSIISRSVRAFSPVRGRDNRNCTASR